MKEARVIAGTDERARVAGGTPSPARRLGGALRLLHPFPSLMNALATLLFAALASGGAPGWDAGARLAGTIFASQAALGIANDWADRDLDRATKPWKPLVAGLVPPGAALALLAAALLAAGVGAASFGPASLLLVALGTGIGLAYDLWLKRTALSWLPYLLAIPLEPLWVWTALGRFTPRLLWLYPLGAALLLALHLANALADLEGDTAAGVGGLVQRLGRRRAEATLWLAALLPAAVATLIGLVVPYRWGRFWPGLALALLPTLIAMAVARRRRGREEVYRVVFGLLIASTILLAVAWLGAAV
ncbi:MAG: UbiA family prenyltransferase [Chloroflexota bacterium]|nr:UbiA family prenyltransferase [Chloroflexota bacterium]